METLEGDNIKTMETGTTFTVRPPVDLTIRADLTPEHPGTFSLEKQGEPSLLEFVGYIVAYSTGGITFSQSLPLYLNEKSLPYFIAKTDIDNELPRSASISVTLNPKENQGSVTIRGLQPYSQIFGKDCKFRVTIAHDAEAYSWRTDEVEVYPGSAEVNATLFPVGNSWNYEEGPSNSFFAHDARNHDIRSCSAKEGTYSIKGAWVFKPRPKSNELYDKLGRHIDFITAEPFDHAVELVAREGKRFKISKATLAAFSPKIEKQFQFVLDRKVDAKAYKEIKIYHGVNVESDDDCLGEDGILALIRFLTMNSIAEPLKNPTLALELLMCANYNMIEELENSMKTTLLGQPLELMDVETSLYLYWFASLHSKIVQGQTDNDGSWERLKVRALWNLNWCQKDKLESNDVFQQLFPDRESRENILSGRLL